MRIIVLAALMAFSPAAASADESQLSFALEGGTWTLRNGSCSSFVVSVDSDVYASAPHSAVPLRQSRWKGWWWMPGERGAARPRSVSSPLQGEAAWSSGPGQGLHTGDSRYAYDFPVPEGTPVYPVEGGVVIKVVDLYEGPHRDKKRLAENNRVLVQHRDGTVAVYAHLKKDSVLVKECEKVTEDDMIAESGNTGYSDEPHLHVEVFRARSGRRNRTVPLTFSPRYR